MIPYLSVEHGQLQLGSTMVAGVLQRLSVAGSVRFDQAEQDGLSGKAKVPMGWDDAAITATVTLPTDAAGTCYDKLAELSRLYKGHDASGNPMIYRTTNAHLAARDIDEVVFDGLHSEEDSEDDTLTVTLRFVEHRPPILEVELRKQAGSNAAPDSTPKEPGLSPEILGGR